LTGDLVMTAQTVHVGTSSELALGSRHLDLAATTVTVDGTLSMGASSRLFLGAAAALTVPVGGSLRMVGIWNAPAVVDGPVGGAYVFTVNGAIEAMNYEFHHMGPNGIVIAP